MTTATTGRRPSACARRLARPLLLFAPLGAALSLMVATISAVWIPFAPAPSPPARPAPPPATDLDRFGPLPAHWGAPLSASEHSRPGLARRQANGLLRPDVSMSGAWSATRIDAGFPAPCLTARRLWDSEAGDLSASPWRSGAVIPSAWRPWKHDPRRYNSILPLRPLPAGLAINTLAWAATLWLILRGSRLARRAWRLRHARCPTCGYPKPDDSATEAGPPLHCPECGAQ